MQDTGNVLVESAAGDVADAVDVAPADHVEHRLYIDFRRGEQHLAQRAVTQFGIDLVQFQSVVRQHLRTSEKPLEWTPDEAIPTSTSPVLTFDPSMSRLRSTTPTVNPAMSYFAAFVHARHLGRLAAYERTARLTAPLGHAADDALDLDRFVVPHGHIIEEKSGSAP